LLQALRKSRLAIDYNLQSRLRSVSRQGDIQIRVYLYFTWHKLF